VGIDPMGIDPAEEDEMQAKGLVDEKIGQRASPSGAGEGELFARPFERSFSKISVVTRALPINSGVCSSARWTSATSRRRTWLESADAVWNIMQTFKRGKELR
jgi:hypothetical protein